MLYRYVGHSMPGLSNGTYVYVIDSKKIIQACILETSQENLCLFKNLNIKDAENLYEQGLLTEVNDSYALHNFIKGIINRQNFINKKVKQLIKN